MPYVYFLRCEDNSLYCGYTVDLRHRVAQHQLGRGAKYTRARLPVSLVYAEELPDKSAALQREAQLKKLSRAQKLELIMQNPDRFEGAAFSPYASDDKEE